MRRNNKYCEVNTEKVNFEALGDIVKQARIMRGYSQYYVASKSNVHQSSISRLENGKFNINIDKLLKILSCLNAELEFSLKLFNGDPIE